MLSCITGCPKSCPKEKFGQYSLLQEPHLLVLHQVIIVEEPSAQGLKELA